MASQASWPQDLCSAWLRPDFWKSGDLEIWKFGLQKIQKIKILKIQIRSAQNVGKVWISRKKSSWPHLVPFQGIFCVGRQNRKNAKILPIFLGGPMGPIHPVWGHVLVSFIIQMLKAFCYGCSNLRMTQNPKNTQTSQLVTSIQNMSPNGQNEYGSNPGRKVCKRYIFLI